MNDKDELEAKLAELNAKIEEIMRVNSDFPQNPTDYEAVSIKEQARLKTIWGNLLEEIRKLTDDLKKQNLGVKQKTEEKIAKMRPLEYSAGKTFHDTSTKYNKLTENVSYKAYKALYEEATEIRAQIAKLKSQNQLAVALEEVPTPEPTKPPEEPGKKLPSWVTSIKDKKEIHLLAAVLQPDSKWLEAFSKNHNLTMGDVQENQTLKFVSKDNKKNEIVLDKTGVYATFEKGDFDAWIKTIIELYIQAVKDRPNIIHKINTPDLALQRRIEFTLAKALSDKGLFTDDVTINSKSKKELIKDPPAIDETKRTGLGM